MNTRRLCASLVAGMMLLPVGGLAQQCGDLASDAGGYGPFDYRNPVHRAEKLPVVEAYHFTQSVEMLVKGKSGSVGSDLDYTLRHFPNHARALASMSQLFLRHGGERPGGVRYTLSCWFERARRFAPQDGMVLLVEAVHLQEAGQPSKALEKLLQAARLEPDNANVRYNLGLAYAKTGKLDRAVEEAKAAYGAGFPLPGLKNLLASKGVWPPAD